jgi:hypothetical protein
VAERAAREGMPVRRREQGDAGWMVQQLQTHSCAASSGAVQSPPIKLDFQTDGDGVRVTASETVGRSLRSTGVSAHTAKCG